MKDISPDLLDRLCQFDSKERSNLVRKAFGKGVEKIDPEFKNKIVKEVLGLTEKTTFEREFWAIDFHLDWLSACVHFNENSPQQNSYDRISGSQEDIDFLLALKEGENVHLILIEAKFATGWNRSQLSSKRKRLNKIFSEGTHPYKKILKPYFVGFSPKKSRIFEDELNTSHEPKMFPVQFLKWEHDRTTNICVERCTEEGKPSKSGKHWTVKERRIPF